MAFVLDYLREFPGAEYKLVKKAAMSHGLPAPVPSLRINRDNVVRTHDDSRIERFERVHFLESLELLR